MQRTLLAEIIKHSSINVEALAKFIKDAGERPKWSRMTLPKGVLDLYQALPVSFYLESGNIAFATKADVLLSRTTS